MSVRPVKRIVESVPTMEGAGVKLRRAFGFGDSSETDPFLLFDDFRGDRPQDYLAGFPWHPHRGIETITYVLAGTVAHGDSLGNQGTLGAGDVQWMTAGRGIMHQEMPTGDSLGRMHGFQLWANLPSSLKMTSPRYQDIGAMDIPEVTDDDGTTVRVVCGEFWGKRGPVDGIAAEPQYFDVWVPPLTRKSLPVDTTRSAFAYVFDGAGDFRGASAPFGVLTEKDGDEETVVREMTGNRSLVVFDSGDEVVVHSGEQGIRFLLVSGAPIREPVAWYGPIVMNSRSELETAIRQLRDGSFIQGRGGIAAAPWRETWCAPGATRRVPAGRRAPRRSGGQWRAPARRRWLPSRRRARGRRRRGRSVRICAPAPRPGFPDQRR